MASLQERYYFLFLLQVFPCAFGANVLISSLYGEGSHFILGSSIGEGLLERGHNVTMLIGRAFERRATDPKHANFSFLIFEHQSNSTQEVQDFFSHVPIALAAEEGWSSKLLHTVSIMTEMGAEDCEGILLNETAMKRLESIDAVVIDITWTCGMFIKVMLEQRLKKTIPSISLSPFTPQGVLLYSYGSSYNPTYQPEFNTGFSNHMTFLQRTANIFSSVVQCIVGFIFIARRYSRVAEKISISPDLVTGVDAGYRIFDLHLLNMDFSSEYPFPLAPNFVPVGGLTARPAAPLDEELEQFVQGSEENGIIIFTLGTYFLSAGELLPGFNEMFIEAFRKLPQRVVWQLKSYPKKELPSNVKTMSWVPQNDLLGHPKARLFISQGGNNGFQEACYHAVPMIVIPIHGDQYDVAARVESKGMGRKLDKFEINADLIFKTISDVVNEPKYAASAKKISEIRKSMPMTPRERAAFWIEHVINFGGEYLKVPIYDLSFIQYYMLDVMLFLFAILTGFLTVLFYVIRCLVSLVCRTVDNERKSKVE